MVHIVGREKQLIFHFFFALNEQKYAICCLLMIIMAKKYDEIISDTL